MSFLIVIYESYDAKHIHAEENRNMSQGCDHPTCPIVENFPCSF